MKTRSGDWYHVSPHKLAPGAKLLPSGGSSPHDDWYDENSQQNRKQHVWVEQEPLFLRSWQGEGEKHIYRVKPDAAPRPWPTHSILGEGYTTPSATILEEIHDRSDPITAARKIIRLAQQAADLQWQRSYTDGSWQLMAQDPSGIFQTVVTAPRVQGMYYQISAAHKAIREAEKVAAGPPIQWTPEQQDRRERLEKELLRRERDKEVGPLDAANPQSMTDALQTYIHLDSR